MERRTGEEKNMKSMCGMDCCGKCERKDSCGGCAKTDGHPFGGSCVAAECIKKGGQDEFHRIKTDLIDEINSLGVEHLHVTELYLLNGFFVNMEYTLANGHTVKFLEDKNIYLGNQIEIPGSDRCYGIAANEQYLLVCMYGCNGSNPEVIIYKKRNRGIKESDFSVI